MSYITRTDIEDKFGKKNVEIWADLDNNQVQADITARITTAIAFADEMVDNALRRGRYALPIVDLLSAVPKVIVDVVASIAGVWLYENRGVQDFDPDTGKAQHRLHWQKVDAQRVLSWLRMGQIELNAVSTVSTPEVIV